MLIRTYFIFILLIAFFLQTVSAFETDQFNLPPEPLGDIGFEVTFYVENVVRKSIEKVNSEIVMRENCLLIPEKGCDSTEKNKKRLAFLRSNEAVAYEVYKILGGGVIPYTNSGTWLEKHNFDNQPSRFRPSYRQSLFVFYPTSYFELASTIKMFNSEFGTDKIAHLFQQGFDYYKIYLKSVKQGVTNTEAIKKAVQYGQKTEREIFGMWISGVYSNGDLAANYVGLKFYQGLTEDLLIGNKVRPSVLSLEYGFWTIQPQFKMSEYLLKPFISNHLNEAVNPSGYSRMFGLSVYVRHILKSRICSEWQRAFPELEQKDYEKLTESLRLWNNEDYGWTERKNLVTIANTCFNKI